MPQITFCLFVQNLNPEDVTPTLYERGLLECGDLTIVNNTQIGEEERNTRLFHILQSHAYPVKVITDLKSCIEKKYSYLVDKIESFASARDLPTTCTCMEKVSVFYNEFATSPIVGERLYMVEYQQ